MVVILIVFVDINRLTTLHSPSLPICITRLEPNYSILISDFIFIIIIIFIIIRTRTGCLRDRRDSAAVNAGGRPCRRSLSFPIRLIRYIEMFSIISIDINIMMKISQIVGNL